MSLINTGLIDQVMVVWLDQSYKDKFLCFTFFSKKVMAFSSEASRASRVERYHILL